jgi:conserved oligomeric Golgi complex subunit 8
LRKYLPNVLDKSSRESLLTQVLYSAGSLGRLGGDFGLILALLEEGDEQEGWDRDGDVQSSADDEKANPKDDEHTPTDADKEEIQRGKRPEWVETMKKHRVLAGKLELLASRGGGKDR